MKLFLVCAVTLFFNSLVFSDYYEQALNDFNNRNYSSAFQKFNDLSQNGDPRAQNTLALMYINGYGINSNPLKAEALLINAANGGNVDAQTNLGLFYERGYNGMPNYPEAYKWYNIAAMQGEPRSQYYIGKLLLSGKGVLVNKEKAFEFFVQSAGQGYKPARQMLILTYRYTSPLK